MYDAITWFANSELFWVEAIKVFPIMILMYCILMNLIHFTRVIQVANGDLAIRVALNTSNYFQKAAWEIGMLFAYLIFLFR